MPIGFVEPLRCQITSFVVFTLFLRAAGDSAWTQDTQANAQNHEDGQQNGSEAHGIPPERRPSYPGTVGAACRAHLQACGAIPIASTSGDRNTGPSQCLPLDWWHWVDRNDGSRRGAA